MRHFLADNFWRNRVFAIVLTLQLAILARGEVFAGTVAEVRQPHDSPALFINGKLHTGLMPWTVDPVSRSVVRNGRLESVNR